MNLWTPWGLRCSTPLVKESLHRVLARYIHMSRNRGLCLAAHLRVTANTLEHAQLYSLRSQSCSSHPNSLAIAIVTLYSQPSIMSSNTGASSKERCSKRGYPPQGLVPDLGLQSPRSFRSWAVAARYATSGTVSTGACPGLRTSVLVVAPGQVITQMAKLSNCSGTP